MYIEIVFRVDRLTLERKSFWCLHPKKPMLKEIIDAVATMLTDEKHDSIWWLPTSFQALALNPTTHYKETLEFIIRRFMGYVDETAKYLVVLDLRDSKVVYLDSLKDVTARSDMVKIIDFLEHSIPPNITSDFEFLEPYVAQQDSNDFGVWVAHWMQMASLWASYNPEVVNMQHRYRLATSLVLTKANLKRDECLLAALSYYEGRDGSRVQELDISSDSSSSTKGKDVVNATNDNVEI
ncbi:hypothetical protein PIB30_077649 [Stylosanthes scabra]|uniref:Uncharacterized protein n=1 Tax=Stylosanthes scabra TaxID=79078 RepID=A0ABU6QQ71_9FABA|nr:hypothetical protein [Stylosanthes scabra]